jgi:metacaspase-1
VANQLDPENLHMFNSNRFTAIVTNDTHARLLCVQSNEQPLSRGDSHRGAVAALQGALAALNNAYLSPAEVDGYFGARTARAVEDFQRDYGLVADGIVGRQTISQLDSLFSAPVVRAPRGVSVHVGVDKVDAAHYGSEMELFSCKNDANAMRDLAIQLGYTPTTYLNETATTSNFCAFLRVSAGELFAGDTLLVTFSGHGGQVPNTSDDDEPDLNDETLCFYDRMLIDDELSALLATFREGVRIHLVIDSCHSGTAYKQVLPLSPADVKSAKEQYLKGVDSNLAKATPYVGFGNATADALDKSPIPIKVSQLTAALDGERPQLGEVKANPDAAKTTSELFGLLYQLGALGKSKLLQPEVSFLAYDKNKNVYDAVKLVVGTKEATPLGCTTIVLSACDDSQTTPAGDPLSLFTFNLIQAWDSGRFDGSYTQFHRSVVGRARPDATPQLNTDGTGAAARVFERPFAI